MKKFLEGGHFYEGPRWHNGYWYVSDLYAHQVLKISPLGVSEVVAEIPNQPSGLGWLPDGDLLVVSMKDRKVMRVDGAGNVSEHADIKHITGFYANDMVTSLNGNAYVGNLGFNLFSGERPCSAGIVRIDVEGNASIAAENLLFPNGMVITPDNKTLIVAETLGARLSAFNIAADGRLSDHRVWATVGTAPPMTSAAELGKTDFAPDGCTLDAEGCVWLADAFHGRVARIKEGIGIIEEIKSPQGMGLYSCALGGVEGNDLLLCTAPDFDDVKRSANKEAVLYTVKVNVPAA
jgi:sugar lactone lactonase YvrE